MKIEEIKKIISDGDDGFNLKERLKGGWQVVEMEKEDYSIFNPHTGQYLECSIWSDYGHIDEVHQLQKNQDGDYIDPYGDIVDYFEED